MAHVASHLQTYEGEEKSTWLEEGLEKTLILLLNTDDRRKYFWSRSQLPQGVFFFPIKNEKLSRVLLELSQFELEF